MAVDCNTSSQYRSRGPVRSQFESGNKGHWKRETDKNEVAIKVLSSITTKAVSQLSNGAFFSPFSKVVDDNIYEGSPLTHLSVFLGICIFI